ncbi:dipeptidase [Aequorivita sp. KMM 9714]|uniref:dipeptidase n=1 Tax=Aequorivita sp. KMM 9714 TaxID=2707173 RepID=UPI0013EBE52A|nr:dipeptidase [Aequorivita sp. KMM 9714]NGX83429.1 membrane dipeptidase [Aequorivita sp. KMM 9714]
MKKFTYLLLALSFILGSCGNKKEEKKEESNKTVETVLEKAKRIHDNVITIDTHVDFDVRNFTAEKNYTQELPVQVDLPKMDKGGLDAVFLIVYTGQGDLTTEGYKKAYENADAKFNAIHRLTKEYASDQIELATSVEDVRRIAKSGKKIALIGIENGYPMGEDISKLQEFYDRGARYLSLAHNGHNQLADSNTGEEDDVWLYKNNLSELGKEAVAELNRLGIMIDVSHPSTGSNKETLALSKAPVIASHSSARALNDVSRNLWDDELLAIKENGGVVQAVAFASYINSKKDSIHKAASRKILDEIAKEMDLKILSWPQYRELDEAEAEIYLDKYRKLQATAKPRIEKEINPIAPPVDVKDFVDHIDYMVKLLGIDYVGISSDFDGGGGVYGWRDASETFNVTLELVKRGYSEEDIAKLWGENLLRVMEEVEKVAAKIQSEEKAN